MTERKRYTKQTYGTPYNHIKPHQCKYDRVHTLTVHHTKRQGHIIVSTMRAYTNGTAYKHDEEPLMRVRP